MSITARYESLLAAGELKPDERQQHIVAQLADLQAQLENPRKKSSFLSRLTGQKSQAPRGLYIWGDVGRGKSMLMDLFYDSIDFKGKARRHFHEFMLDMHVRMRRIREDDPGDPIPKLVREISSETQLLCFDEMVVNNMADAAIMSRLFTGLLGAGITIVTTSNRVPDDLYKDGLNRQLFLPFIDLIKQQLDILALNGPTDYRRERLGNAETWLVPNGEDATKALSDTFFRLTDYPPGDAENVPSYDLDVGAGRILRVPKALKGVAVFSFKRLCMEARGASDYLSIARHYHTVIIVGIPILGPHNRNEAARFVKLIDALYEYRVKLLASADARPDDLYPEGDGKFEFERTVSRLLEMQSEDYLALGHGADSDPAQKG